MRHLINTKILLPIILIAGITLFIGIANTIYLDQSEDLDNGDQLGHLIESISVYNHETELQSYRSSPGIYYITAFLYKIFGTNEYVAISTNLLFLILLLISTYVITYYFSQNMLTSTYAIILVSLYPMTYGLSRYYLVGLSLMASVCFCIAMFILSDNFKRQRYSLLLGIAIGIGPLSKESFPIFILPIGLIALFKICKEKLSSEKIINLIICLLSANIFLSLWLFRNFIEILGDSLMRGHYCLPTDSAISIFPISKFLFYLNPLINFIISPGLFLLFIIALIPFIKKNKKDKIILFSWILFPLLFFSFFNSRMARYIAPIVPAFAIITALGIQHFSRRTRNLLYIISILFAFIQFFATSFPVPFLSKEYFIETKAVATLFSSHPRNYHFDFDINPPKKRSSGGKEILAAIKRYQDAHNIKNIHVCIIHNRISRKQKLFIEGPFATSLQYYNINNEDYNYNLIDAFLTEKHILLERGSHTPLLLSSFNILIAYDKPLEHTYDFVLEEKITTNNHLLNESEEIFMYVRK
ncbi:ArnT family glycosyltransferase [Candidatus Omnitrophota bacterium]